MNFAPGKIPLRGKNPGKCIYSVAAQETAKHRAKFRWLPLSDIAAVTETRLESLRNFLGALNSPIGLNRYSGPKFTILWGVWRRYCCLTSFFSDCRYVPQLRRYSPTKLCDGAQMAIFASFLRPVFSASRMRHISDMHCKFALRPHHVWKYGRHPISDR